VVYDERAVEQHARLKDKYKGKITVISMGSEKASDLIKPRHIDGGRRWIVLSDGAFENLDSFWHGLRPEQGHPEDRRLRLNPVRRQAVTGALVRLALFLAEILGIPVVTLACDIDAVDNNIKVRG